MRKLSEHLTPARMGGLAFALAVISLLAALWHTLGLAVRDDSRSLNITLVLWSLSYLAWMTFFWALSRQNVAYNDTPQDSPYALLNCACLGWPVLCTVAATFFNNPLPFLLLLLTGFYSLGTVASTVRPRLKSAAFYSLLSTGLVFVAYLENTIAVAVFRSWH